MTGNGRPTTINTNAIRLLPQPYLSLLTSCGAKMGKAKPKTLDSSCACRCSVFELVDQVSLYSRPCDKHFASKDGSADIHKGPMHTSFCRPSVPEQADGEENDTEDDVGLTMVERTRM